MKIKENFSLNNFLTKIKNKISARKNKKADKIYRSFRLTKKRDYERPFEIPGYFKLTKEVFSVLLKNKKTFIPFVIIIVLITLLLIGMSSQDLYLSLINTLDATKGDFFNSFAGQIESAGLLFVASVSGGITQALSIDEQIFLILVLAFSWLTTVWLLRNILSGNKVKLRDAIYSAGSPIVATLILGVILIVQLIPLSIVLVGYGAALTTGLLEGGVEAMLFWVAAGLLTTLSIYWISSTFFAIIIATIPGMYPMKALNIAESLVRGRRLKISMRLLWLGLVTLISWAIVFIPIILFDIWIKTVFSGIEWIPIIPVLILISSAATIIWISSYIYVLYRKIVEYEPKQ